MLSHRDLAQLGLDTDPWRRWIRAGVLVPLLPGTALACRFVDPRHADSPFPAPANARHGPGTGVQLLPPHTSQLARMELRPPAHVSDQGPRAMARWSATLAWSWAVRLRTTSPITVSHLSAAGIYGWSVPEPSSTQVHVYAPHAWTAHARPGVRIHTPGAALPDRCMLFGLTVTTPVRTAVDAIALLSRDEAIVALDSACHATPGLTARLRQISVGARHRRHWQEVLALSDHLSESVAESQLRLLLHHHDVPAPVAQIPIEVDGRFVTRADFGYREVKIAIFVDGFAYHRDRRAFERDRRQRAVLSAAGWLVLVVTAAQVRDDPVHVVTVLRRAIACRRDRITAQ